MENKLAEKQSQMPDVTKKQIPKKEFIMYSVAGLGQGMIYAMMSSYISDFYINVLQLPLIFVMMLMLLARVWDAINDPMMGVIVDKYTTRWGKMKPYVIFTALPVCALTFLLFFDPGLKSSDLMVYVAFTYVLWGMIYTVSDVPFWSLPNVMTSNPVERADTLSIGRTFNGIGSAIPMGLFLVFGFILPKIFPNTVGVDLEKRKYMIMAIFCSLLGTVLFVNSFFHVKERIVIPNRPVKGKDEPSTLKRVFKCKPLMIVVLMGILSSGRYMVQAAAPHVARYAFYVGPALEGLSAAERTACISQSVSIVSTVFTVCAAIGMFGAMLCMPLLYRKFSYKKIVIASCLGGVVASGITTLMGCLGIAKGWSWTFYACIPFIVISSIPLGALNNTSYAMIGDCLDYMELTTGYRDTALGSACQSFVNKLGNALATTMIVIMYMIISLDPAQMLNKDAVVAAVELSTSKRIAMFSLVSVVPGISLLLCAIPVFFYDLDGEKKDRIVRELELQRKEKGIVVEID